MPVEAQVLKGMRDFLPPRMILRQHVIDELRHVFELHGFEPLDTPAIEYAETLEGKFGDEADKLIYEFEDRGGRRVGLRYDLTVPLARVVGSHPELVKPFKRYQISPVWRGEKPAKGRYREFWQCDVDTVGSSSMLADAEVVTVGYESLRRIGFSKFRTKINNRKVLAAIAQYAGVSPEQAGLVYRAIDKLEKIGLEAVKAELVAANIEQRAVDRLMEILQTQGTPETVLSELASRLATYASGIEGVHELQEIVRYLEDSGVPREFYEIDFTMVRGLDYYTGPIFETTVEEPKIGSICGGGRYDGLVGMFTHRQVPATGISLGLERIIDVLESLREAGAPGVQTVTTVLVTVFDASTLRESLRLASELRFEGVNTEVFLGKDKLGSQLRYASRKGIPYAIIIGPDEIAQSTVVVKDLAKERQVTVERGDIAAFFHGAHTS